MGPTLPFLLMYGSHDMRHTDFRRLTVVNETPEFLGHHIGTTHKHINKETHKKK